MKVKYKESKPGFKPIELTIILETQEEANAFFGMCLTNDSVPYAVIESWGKLMKGPNILKQMLYRMGEQLSLAGMQSNG